MRPGFLFYLLSTNMPTLAYILLFLFFRLLIRLSPQKSNKAKWANRKENFDLRLISLSMAESISAMFAVFVLLQEASIWIALHHVKLFEMV